MSTSSSLLAWSPVLVGFMLSVFMYGTTLGQSIYYSYWFPHDFTFMKALVFVMLLATSIFSLADTAHLIGTTQLFWAFFVTCHRSDTWNCNHNLPWGGLVMTCLNTTICFAVQCFYSRRIWTISGKNRFLTVAVFASGLAEFISGVLYNVDVGRVGTIQYLFQCPLILPITIAGTVCNILITSVAIKYLWRSGFRKQRTIIQDLAVICINMGAFTCVISIATGIMFLIQGTGYWVASIGMILAQSYVNSMLTVLNARRVIRDRRAGRDVSVYELSTI